MSDQTDQQPPLGLTLPAAGWYPDPAHQFAHRYWDGGGWTSWVAADNRTIERLLPVPVDRRPLADLPGTAVVLAVVAAIAAIGASKGVSTVVDDSLIRQLVLSQTALWGTLTLTLVYVSRTYGSGNLLADYGIRVRARDLAGGLAAGIASRVMAAVGIILVIAAFQGDEGRASGGEFEFFEPDAASFYTFLAFAVIGAPIIEEIFFRGLVQRALEPALGAVGAVAIQAVLFGAAHLQIDASASLNLQILVGISFGGAVLGAAFQLTRRLGTSMVAHALFNAVFALFALADRYGWWEVT